MSDHVQSTSTTVTVGIAGTIASWTLSGFLSLAATVCTLVVVGPKAWAQLVEWRAKYEPRVLAWWRR